MVRQASQLPVGLVRGMLFGFRSWLEHSMGWLAVLLSRRFRVKFRGRVLLCVLMTAISTSVVVGCSGQGVTSSPYAEDFRQANDLATSDFERAILKDGKVSRSEYEEAMQRYVSCIRDGGGSVELSDQSGYYVYNISGDIDQYDEMSEGCSQGTTVLIEPLYVDTLTNPDKIDSDEAIARCYVAAGLVRAPFGAQDLRDLMVAAGAEGDSAGTPIDPAAEEIVNSEKSMKCMANPSSMGEDG